MNEDILNQLGQGAAPAAEPTTPTEEGEPEIKYEDKKKSSGKKIDDEVLQSLLANGDNTKGLFTPNPTKDSKDDSEHEEVDEKAKLKSKGDAKPSDKYATEFEKHMKEHPEEYFINTPKGKMSLKEAEEKGYDPITHRFTRKQKQQEALDEQLKDLNDSDKSAIKKLLDPKEVGLSPADAEMMGIDPTNPTIKREEATPPVPAPAPQMPGAMPTQGEAPMPANAGQDPLAALLGGGQ